MIQIIRKSNLEEWANSVTHGLGLLFSFIGFWFLIWKSYLSQDLWQLFSAFVFGFTLLFLYSASTTYHIVRKGKWKRWLQIMDHIGIFLLIAGTYTPFTLLLFNDFGGWTMFWFIWSVAIIGIFYKIFLINKYPRFSTFLYLLMGWTIMVKIDIILWSMPSGATILLLTGGFFYTAGVVFYIWEKLKFSHAIWHLFVLAGSLCHYFAVYFYVIH